MSEEKLENFIIEVYVEIRENERGFNPAVLFDFFFFFFNHRASLNIFFFVMVYLLRRVEYSN